MAKFNRFQDIDAWKMARELSREIYTISAREGFARDYALRDQIRRAAISILSNIAEGFERGGDKEFRQFLSAAKGSAGEIRAQLDVALDAGYIDLNAFNNLSSLCDQIGRMIGGLMPYLSRSPYDGVKFRDRNDVTSGPLSEDPSTPDAGLETQDSGLGTRDSVLIYG